MSEHTGLAGHEIIAFVNIFKVEEAKHFYRDVLGLRLVSEDLPFALVFDAKGTMLRLSVASGPPQTAGTVLGWKVADIRSAAQMLQQAGVRFERYAFLDQDSAAIWTAPGGAKIAWFLDPDGNTLSISQHEA
jgi:catechol 2,3-dioxygenase-like lactoylglutathione lyase family enzyme